MSFRAVARHLPAEWSMYARDLRGRGGSAAVPGPYVIGRHAADVCRAAEEFGHGRPLALTRQSLGAYVALGGATDRPELIDGGPYQARTDARPAPPHVSLGAVAHASLRVPG